jgi:hypothetical protein
LWGRFMKEFRQTSDGQAAAALHKSGATVSKLAAERWRALSEDERKVRVYGSEKLLQ